jgi:hypothetical protein
MMATTDDDDDDNKTREAAHGVILLGSSTAWAHLHQFFSSSPNRYSLGLRLGSV